MAASAIRQIVLLTLALAVAAPAFAQLVQPTLRPGRPARGLFGGGVGDTEQSLALNISFGAGQDWEESVAPSLPPGAAQPITPFHSGTYGSTTAALSYGLAREKVSGGASLAASGRYNTSQNASFGSVGASGQITFQFTTRTSLSASQGISYQPHNIEMLYGTWTNPGAAPTALMNLSSATTGGNQFLVHSAVGFSHLLTRRVALTSGYSFQSFDAFAANPATGSKTQTANVGLSFALGRGLRFGAGYRQTTAKYGTEDPVTYGGPTLDGGLTLDRAISLTRRTKFGFGAGVSGVRDIDGQLRYFLEGQASLTHEIGRSWTATLNYRRGVDFTQGFKVPVVLDSASVGAGGNIGRRFELTAGGGAAMGDLGVGTGAPGFTVVNGYTALRTAIFRSLGISVRYAYTQYKFDDPTSVPFGLPPETRRHSVLASLDVWIPLYMRVRRANASR